MREAPTETALDLANKRIERMQMNMRRLLNLVGVPGSCRGCGRPVWWVKHTVSAKAAPYNEEGLNHFADCPRATEFRKKESP